MSGTRPFLRSPAITAVLAASSGTGHTAVVANLAWLLCAAGKRVLIIDWGSRAPRVGDYLRPFLNDRFPVAEKIGRGLFAVSGQEGPPPRVDRFVPPDVSGHMDVVAASTGESGSPDPAAITEFGRVLATAEFDHVLIDAPTRPSEAVENLLAHLCHTAVVCSRQSTEAISEAAELAGRITRAAPVRIDVVAVTTMFDVRGDAAALQRTRSGVYRLFGEAMGSEAGALVDDGVVEIPYRAYEPSAVLAVLLEPDASTGAPAPAYERLASTVTGGDVSALVPPSATLLARYRRMCGHDDTAAPDRVALAYAPPDRPWADWVRVQLERAGAEVCRLAAGAEGPQWSRILRPRGHRVGPPVRAEPARRARLGTIRWRPEHASPAAHR